MSRICSFLTELSSYTSSVNVFNPWADFHPDFDTGCKAPLIRRNNLEQYLRARVERARYMLVAEALGYQGGRFSGIAMTSERMLIGKHKSVHPSRILPTGRTTRTSNSQCDQFKNSWRNLGFTEPTATTVWTSIIDYEVDPYEIILWNIFPFHPFQPDEGFLTNRSGPTNDELEIGSQYLRKLLDICLPTIEVIAVGIPSKNVLSAMGISHIHVPHPANGGTPEFRRQFKEIVAPHL